jgi:hypothetical protein
MSGQAVNAEQLLSAIKLAAPLGRACDSGPDKVNILSRRPRAPKCEVILQDLGENLLKASTATEVSTISSSTRRRHFW